jgi:hypothetical protein
MQATLIEQDLKTLSPSEPYEAMRGKTGNSNKPSATEEQVTGLRMNLRFETLKRRGRSGVQPHLGAELAEAPQKNFERLPGQELFLRIQIPIQNPLAGPIQHAIELGRVLVD